MKAFTRETSTVAVIPGVNCDTDQIIPGRFLKADRAQGYGQFLFHDIRRTDAHELDPAFPLNRPGAEHSTVLLVEDNFGCGSSREGAVYALVDHGIRALIGPSFGDIFFNNALKNGLVPVRLAADQCQSLAEHLNRFPDAEVTVDLAASELILPGNLGRHPIIIDAFARECILQGLDEIEMTFTYMDKIKAFESDRMASHAWLGR
ncbi:3-isopropylmalate dehydratase small subunit [Rhizobium sp. SGZ-381]|uniref:3-isopropylmalate dehydratase small subunit n=1 Tax=Rhizobium sp. SGZ-381 TaxID=3342800 RepID=UPI0036730545